MLKGPMSGRYGGESFSSMMVTTRVHVPLCGGWPRSRACIISLLINKKQSIYYNSIKVLQIDNDIDLKIKIEAFYKTAKMSGTF